MAYSPDAYDTERPTGGDLVQIPEELRGIKERIGEETDGKMDRNLPIQKVDPTGSSGKTANGSTTVNLSNGTFQHYRVVSDVTFSFSVPTLPSDYVPFFVLRITNGGNHNVTWPSGTRWPLGIPPLLTEGGTDMLVFYRPYPGATFWEGVSSGFDMKEEGG